VPTWSDTRSSLFINVVNPKLTQSVSKPSSPVPVQLDPPTPPSFPTLTTSTTSSRITTFLTVSGSQPIHLPRSTGLRRWCRIRQCCTTCIWRIGLIRCRFTYSLRSSVVYTFQQRRRWLRRPSTFWCRVLIGRISCYSASCQLPRPCSFFW
jgi:hypothetical protein